MKFKNIIIGILTLIIFVLIFAIVYIKITKKSNLDLKKYVGYWYIEEKIEDEMFPNYDELHIYYVDNDLVLDYKLSMLCDDKNIKVNSNGEFTSSDSTGTVEFKEDSIIMKVNNIHYEEDFNREFKYKEENKR